MGRDKGGGGRAPQPRETLTPPEPRLSALAGAELSQVGMFRDREVAQFGVKARPQMSAERPGGGGLLLELQMQDARTPEEIQRDQRIQEAERNVRLWQQSESAYEAAKALPASQLDQAPADSEVASTLWSMSYYDEQGIQHYRRDLIEEQENELMNDIDQLGRDKPRVQEVEGARVRSAAILAAYEHENINIPAKQRQRLINLSQGDTEGEIYKIKDNRKLGKRSFNKGTRKSSFESAAAADGRAILEENRLFMARVRGTGEKTKQAFPSFKPSRLKNDS